VTRIFSAILLLTAFSVQIFSGAFIKLGYIINPDFFVKNCVNKTRPKMHCNGKCLVMKKMQEEEKKEQENETRKWDNKITVLSSKSFFYSIEANCIYFVKPTPVEQKLAVKDISLSVFRPPQA
jgi:hypothetical protein